MATLTVDDPAGWVNSVKEGAVKVLGTQSSRKKPEDLAMAGSVCARMVTVTGVTGTAVESGTEFFLHEHKINTRQIYVLDDDIIQSYYLAL